MVRNSGTSVKCQMCNNQTLNPSGRCYLHENSDPDSLAESSVGISSVPPSAVQSLVDEDGPRTEIKRLDPEVCKITDTEGRVTPTRYIPGQNASPIDDRLVMSIRMPRPGDPSEPSYDAAVETLGEMIEIYQGADGKWIQPEMVYELHDVVGNGLRPHRIERYLEDWSSQLPQKWTNQLEHVVEMRDHE